MVSTVNTACLIEESHEAMSVVTALTCSMTMYRFILLPAHKATTTTFVVMVKRMTAKLNVAVDRK